MIKQRWMRDHFCRDNLPLVVFSPICHDRWVWPPPWTWSGRHKLHDLSICLPASLSQLCSRRIHKFHYLKNLKWISDFMFENQRFVQVNCQNINTHISQICFKNRWDVGIPRFKISQVIFKILLMASEYCL